VSLYIKEFSKKDFYLSFQIGARAVERSSLHVKFPFFSLGDRLVFNWYSTGIQLAAAEGNSYI
jgi:hypothetical protein